MRIANHTRWFSLLLLGCLGSTLFAPPAPAADDAKEATKSPKKVTLVRFTLKESLPESAGAAGIFGDVTLRLSEVLNRLDKAAKDDKVSGVILALRSPGLGMGKVNELRAAVDRVRKAGKKVYADIQSGDNKDYLVAAACDEIIIPPSGSLMVNGLAAEVTFYKKLLDKLGVQADFIQIGAFKGAAEPMTRTEMSPEFRKQFESVIDDYYQLMVETIAKDRHLDEKQVRELIDRGLLTAEQAKKAGLVDRVCYEDEFHAEIKKQLDATELAIDREYGKKKIDTDFSGVTGFMKLMELMMGAEPTKKISKSEKIAVVYAVGPIMDGESKSGLFGDETVGGDTIVKALRKAKDDSNIKAIVLRVDSPGGSALASDLIWREIVTAEKPVIASMGDTAASGGYYISMGADKIFAEPGTLTGSIGVVGGKLAMKGLLDKVGVTAEVIRRGKNAGTFSMIEPFSTSERDAWKTVMEDIYKQFTSKAAEGRKMDVKKLEDLAGGRIFTGRMAAQNGLVDSLGTLEDAIAEAKKQAGLKAEDKVELQLMPEPKSFLEELFSGPSIESETRLLAPALTKQLRGLDYLFQLFQRPAATVMPFLIEIK